jgi:polygalacturonase
MNELMNETSKPDSGRICCRFMDGNRHAGGKCCDCESKIRGNRRRQLLTALPRPIRFRKEDFPVTNYGAKSCDVKPVEAWVSFVDRKTLSTPVEGAHDCYPAIRAAIEACHKAGGGRVLIPAGNWFCAGPIVLLSNVNVHLQAGAHIYFSNRPEDYAKYGEFDCGRAVSSR